MLVRAAQRAEEKDQAVIGTIHAFPKRVILPDFSGDHFLEVAADSGFILDGSFGSPSALISMVRANELAQAVLARAKDRVATEAPSSVVAEGAMPAASTLTSIPAGWPSRCSLRIKNMSFK